jgi:hypothetical protein
METTEATVPAPPKSVETDLILHPSAAEGRWGCSQQRCHAPAVMIVVAQKWMPRKRKWYANRKGYCAKHGPAASCPPEWLAPKAEDKA